MSYVAVYAVTSPDTPNKVLTHFEDIAALLAEQGVRFERWQPGRIEKGASDAQIIEACREQISALGYQGAEVFSVVDGLPQPDAVRAQWLKERRYSEDHVCCFVSGQGVFALHVGDYLYAVRCEKNDLLVIPAGMAHWFDMGHNPYFITLRPFMTEQGVIPQFTGADMAGDFPGMDD